jgi:hypothetical protein
MVQGRDGARFALESLLELRIVGQVRWQDLDGDVAFEAGIASAIDFTHAAGTQWGNDLVWAKFLPSD